MTPVGVSSTHYSVEWINPAMEKRPFPGALEDDDEKDIYLPERPIRFPRTGLAFLRPSARSI
jgi:hypothetical protein